MIKHATKAVQFYYAGNYKKDADADLIRRDNAVIEQPARAAGNDKEDAGADNNADADANAYTDGDADGDADASDYQFSSEGIML